MSSVAPASAPTADALRALANKAIQRVALGVGMTELMPDDVRLLQRAAQELAPADSINLTFALSDQFCADVMCTALEGGIGYWSLAEDIEQADGSQATGYRSAVLTDAEEQDDWRHTLDYAAIRRGIQRALAPTFSLNDSTKGAIFAGVARLDAGEIDAEAADAIVQAACFNDLVYG